MKLLFLPILFIATWLAVTNCGAIVPISDNRTYNIDVSLIEQRINEKTKAIIPIHLYGQSADLDKILEIANEYNLYVIEDAAQPMEQLIKAKE